MTLFRMLRIVFFFLFIFTMLPPMVSEAEAQPLDYTTIVQVVDSRMEIIQQHVRFFSNLQSRVTWSPGAEEAAQYIYGKFTEYGLLNVSFDSFPYVDAVNYGANLTILSPSYEVMGLYPLGPNLVCPPTLPPGGITGNLIYVGGGLLSDFDGKAIEGNIVLMDFNTNDRWLDAAMFGAKAVIFMEPSVVFATENPSKSVPVPWNFPRFYIRKDEALRLLSLLDEGEVRVQLQSTVRWGSLTGKNVLGFVRGTEHPDQWVMLTSYYDSYSVAPSLAPGAQEATGIATLLELAWYLGKNPPKYSVLFIAYSGHHQGLAGARSFIWRNFVFDTPKKERVGRHVILNVNLDLSTGSPMTYLAWYGSWHSGLPQDKDFTMLFDFLDYHRQVTGDINAQAPGGKNFKSLDEFRGGLSLTEIRPNGRRGYNYDHEPLGTVRLPAYTITTPFDDRPFFETPQDTFENVNFENLQSQVEYIFCFVSTFLSKENLRGLFSNSFNWELLRVSWSWLNGTAAYYDPFVGWYKPIPNALVIIDAAGPRSGRSWQEVSPESLMLEEEYYYQYAEENGDFAFAGVYAYAYKGFHLDAYVVDPVSGNILYNHDEGPFAYTGVWAAETGGGWGTGGVKGWFPGGLHQDQIGFFTLFKCGSILVFSDLDTKNLLSQVAWKVVTLVEEVNPPSWGLSSYATSTGRSLTLISFPPETKVKLLAQAPSSFRYPTGLLVNGTDDNPGGYGYVLKPGEVVVLNNTVYQIAKELFRLNEKRMSIPLRYGLIQQQVVDDHEKARSLLVQAAEDLRNHRYSSLYDKSIDALRLEIDVYSKVRSSIEDSASVVPIFGVLLIPFVLLAERLFFGWEGMKRVFAFIILFAIFAVSLFALHPGFSFVASAPMILIGFAILVLISPVLVITASHIVSFFADLRVKILGPHFVEIGKMSAFVTAFAVGTENIKKRRLRAALTFASIVLMVTGITSLTSITAIMGTASTSYPAGNPLYNGIYIHKQEWGRGSMNIGENIVQYIQREYGNRSIIAPRAVLYTLSPSVGAIEYLFKIEYQGKNATAYALLGLTPQESQLSGIDGVLSYGRWFEPGDTRVMIVSETAAKKLGITELPTTVSMFGVNYTIIGVITDEYNHLLELDGEPFTPLLLNIPFVFQYHELGNNVFIVKYSELVSAGSEQKRSWFGSGGVEGASVVSISMKFDDTSLIDPTAREIFRKVQGGGFLVFSSVNGTTSLYRPGMEFSVFGFREQSILVAIASLSLLNLMLGAVHERRREISTYSTVGLSPFHIASFFLAESTVYAVVGGTMGFIVAMLFSKLGEILLKGAIILNYSSTWAIIGVGTAILVTTVSSIYPMRLASMAATPSLERTWKIPTSPHGNEWVIPFPLSISDEKEVQGVINFLSEFVKAHVGEKAEHFWVSGITMEKVRFDDREGASLSMETALAPYDQGIKQKSSVILLKNPVTRRFDTQLTIERRSGTYGLWTTSNKVFANEIRKQLLIWKSLPREKKEPYMKG